LRVGLQRASAWLADAPPARREIVVISDFQRGALDREDLDRVPASIGVRAIAVGRAPAQRTFPGLDLIGRSGNDVARQAVSITAAATSVTIEHQKTTETNGVPGVRFIGTSPDAMLRVLATVGTPAGDVNEPIAMRFAGADKASGTIQATPVAKGWMLRTVVRLRNDPTLASASTAVRASELAGTGSWLTLATDAEGKALVRAASAANELVLDVASPADSLYAATVVRAALIARAASVNYGEQEIARVDDSVRSAWNRTPGGVSLSDWKSLESTDARWCWVAVLGLLGVEQWLRSRSQRYRANEVTRAAA
jgi:hypothetical protein